MKRTIEIEDNLTGIVESLCDDVKQFAKEYVKENNCEEKPCLNNDLDYNGTIHQMIDSAVPIYTKEIDDLFYLYGNEFEQAFDNAGIGEKNDKWPQGWKPAAIYCYLQEKVNEFYDGLELEDLN